MSIKRLFEDFMSDSHNALFLFFLLFFFPFPAERGTIDVDCTLGVSESSTAFNWRLTASFIRLTSSIESVTNDKSFMGSLDFSDVSVGGSRTITPSAGDEISGASPCALPSAELKSSIEGGTTPIDSHRRSRSSYVTIPISSRNFLRVDFLRLRISDRPTLEMLLSCSLITFSFFL
jgi:hypothetical protein